MRNGDLKVSQMFVVPSDKDQWPQHLWGIRLGYLVSLIRNGNAFADHKEELIEMGFDYNKQNRGGGKSGTSSKNNDISNNSKTDKKNLEESINFLLPF